MAVILQGGVRLAKAKYISPCCGVRVLGEDGNGACEKCHNTVEGIRVCPDCDGRGVREEGEFDNVREVKCHCVLEREDFSGATPGDR